MIELRSISKSFDSIIAVKDLSITVRAGRICGFLGPNGAGKTTTLRMLMNIIRPDTGEILFDGSKARPESFRVGYLPEERGLYQKITVLETLQYFAGLRNVPDPDTQIKHQLKRFDLDARMHSKVSELSKGNQQKLQFINTILHNPDYIVLDEPFSGLDPVNQLILKEVLEDMKRQGKTIIFSSHQMDQVERICDDVALIDTGQLVLAGDLKEIKAKHGSLHLEVSPESVAELNHPYFQTPDIEIRGGSAFIPLANRDRQSLIQEINAVCQIRAVKVAEPGLEELFIQQVKGRTA